MKTFEEEYKRFEPVIKRLVNLSLLGKKIIVKGEENFVRKGPNIIVGNHCGSFKDIATLFKIVPRPIIFTANKMLFNKDEFNFLIKKHLQRHLKNLGFFLNVVLYPLKSYLVNYISTNIGKVGTVPVDMIQRRGTALKPCQEHLKKGRAIVALQGRGRVMKGEENPYVSRFKRGTCIISYNLYKEEGIKVPVTPLALYGTQAPYIIPSVIKVNVGAPMYITDYLSDNLSLAINQFREALEKRVKTLFYELIK